MCWVDCLFCWVDLYLVDKISTLFQQFSRNFTVLDLTCDQELAKQIILKNEKCDFCYVMFCEQEKFRLQYDKVVALENKITANCLAALLNVPVGTSYVLEDFDVVIMPVGLAQSNYCDFDHLAKLGWYTIFLNNGEKRNILIDRIRDTKKIKIVDDSCEHILITNRGPEKNLYKIHSKIIVPYKTIVTFNQKLFYKKNVHGFIVEEVVWQKGINLATYIRLGGFWPSCEVLVEEIQRNFTLEHGDFVYHNIIVQGNRLAAIDGNSQYMSKALSDRLNALRGIIYCLYKYFNLKDCFCQNVHDVPVQVCLLKPDVIKKLVAAGFKVREKYI